MPAGVKLSDSLYEKASERRASLHVFPLFALDSIAFQLLNGFSTPPNVFVLPVTVWPVGCHTSRLAGSVRPADVRVRPAEFFAMLLSRRQPNVVTRRSWRK